LTVTELARWDVVVVICDMVPKSKAQEILCQVSLLKNLDGTINT